MRRERGWWGEARTGGWQKTNLSSCCNSVVRIGGGVGDGAGANVRDKGDARVVLEVLEDGSFVGKACFVASEDDAQGCGWWCDCFDDHVGGLMEVWEVCSSLGEGGVEGSDRGLGRRVGTGQKVQRMQRKCSVGTGGGK